MPISRLFPLAPLIALCAPLLQPHTGVQVPGAAAASIRKARSLYYTPSDKGLQSFHCEVGFDWKTFIQKASNQQVPEGDPRLKYLESIQLSVDDTLHGSGELRWNAPTPPPDTSADSIGKIREGMQQVWSGFFQSWNGFFTGDLVSLDSNAVVEANPAGFHVAVRTGSSLAEEQFDPKLVLQSIHVSTTALDSTLRPSFSPSPEGLLVTSLESSYRQPPSAPPTEVRMLIDYAPVNGFQLPAGLQVAVGPAAFTFQLKNCTVQTQVTPR